MMCDGYHIMDISAKLQMSVHDWINIHAGVSLAQHSNAKVSLALEIQREILLTTKFHMKDLI